MKTLEELKAQHPAIYEAAIAEGRKEEKERIDALMKFIDTDKEAVVDAI